MTERADRAIMRGIRVGYSQPTPFSQTYPDLIEEDDDDDDGDDKTRVGDHYRTSGIGIFSQEGMVRGAGMDTDSEDDGEPLKPVKRPSSNFDKAEEDESDRSYMTVQDTFNGKMDTPAGVADEHVVSMAISVTDRESEADERTTKRPRV